MVEEHENGIVRSLESRAREIASRVSDRWDSEIESVVEREIALVEEHISKVKSVHHQQLESLLEQECYVGSELLQRSQPRYSLFVIPGKLELQQRLGEIDKERRRLQQKYEEKLQQMRERLMALLNRLGQLF